MLSNDLLTQVEKELIAIGASIAAGCQPCTAHHIQTARRAGAGDDEMRLAVEDALAVRRSSTQGMARWADDLLGGPPMPAAEPCTAGSLLRELVSVGAAFAVHSTADLTAHLAAARQLRATDRQIQVAIGLARTIKRVAEHHAETAAAQEVGPPAMAAGCGAADQQDRDDEPTESAVAPSSESGRGAAAPTLAAEPRGVRA